MKMTLWIASLIAAAFCGLSFAQVSETDETNTSTESSASADEEALAEEEAAVAEVLSDAELIYEDDEDSDFIPSQRVTADQSLDYPIDI